MLPSDKKLLKCISQDFSLSQTSKSGYIKRLVALAKLRKTSIYQLIKESKKTLKLIRETYQAACSRKAIVTSVLALVKRSSVVQKKLSKSGCLDDWRLGSKELSLQQTRRYANPKPNAREAEKFIPFEELCRVRDSLSDYNMDKLLLACYTMIAPSRSDLGVVKLIKGKATCPPLSSIKSPNFLWLAPKGSSEKSNLILRCHKTAKNYTMAKPLTKLFPNNLTALVRESLKFCKRKHLFTTAAGLPFTPAHFAKHVSRRLHKIWPIKIAPPGINMLRHSFISHYLAQGNTLTNQQLEWLAEQSGHNCQMQQGYCWQPQDIITVRMDKPDKPDKNSAPKKTEKNLLPVNLADGVVISSVGPLRRARIFLVNI